jgi:hypothetical protein
LKNILFSTSAIVLTIISCNLATVTPSAPVATTEANVTTLEATASPTMTEPATEIPPTETATEEIPSPTAIPSVVIVTATSNGSLGILRGTSMYYDTLGYLQNGQSSQATARNNDGSWLYIYIPAYPSVYGWAFVGTQYSLVQGDVSSLEIRPVDPAVPAYIRNCTYHPMLIQPGNVLLQPQTDSKNNKKQFPPGSYAAYDQSAEGKPKVSAITLKEGVSVDIKKDGLKNSYSCP